MSSGLPHPPGLDDGLGYPFFQSVFDRKSRRMGLGMSMPGTLGYDSPYEAVPLTELEEALLLVAGTGLTGLNLGDIDPSMGADAMVQWTARTWPSSCSNHGTELFFTNAFSFSARQRICEIAWRNTMADLRRRADELAPVLEANGLALRMDVVNDEARTLLDGLAPPPRDNDATARLRRALDDVDRRLEPRRPAARRANARRRAP